MASSPSNPSVQTLGSRLSLFQGSGPGFDLLRLVLSLSIFFTHAVAIAGKRLPGGTLVNNDIWPGWENPFHLILVPMFFALSGFLVTGSLFRLRNTLPFLVFRGLRIFPALIVETCLSAFILGPVFTSLSLREYFQNPRFLIYLSNIFGFVQLRLPGVFLSHPQAGLVNMNLWTMPGEFYSYLFAAFFMGIGLIYSRKHFTMIFFSIAIVLIAFEISVIYTVGMVLYPTNIYSTAIIVYYFFTGCLFYHWKDRIVFRHSYALLALATGYCLMMFANTICIAAFFVSYATIALGLMKPPRLKLLETGDYSYGIYLYGYPITQAFLAMSPATFGGHWALLMLAAGLATACFAAFSWHVIEHPFLRLKKRFSYSWATPPDPNHFIRN